MLTFDERTHIYRYDGKVVPSVTQILQPLSDYSHVSPATLAAAAAFGQAVHKACELDDLGELDEDALSPALAPYLAGWRAFCRDYRARWNRVEQQVYHQTMRYAGTVDRTGLIEWDGHDYEATVDLKSGADLYPSVGPQLAAYERAIGGASPLAKRLGVRLKPDGTYEARFYRDPMDWAVFASLITLRTFCAQHAIQPFKELSHV